MKRRVVVISIDGFAAFYWDGSPGAPARLRRLAERGALAVGHGDGLPQHHVADPREHGDRREPARPRGGGQPHPEPRHAGDRGPHRRSHLRRARAAARAHRLRSRPRARACAPPRSTGRPPATRPRSTSTCPSSRTSACSRRRPRGRCGTSWPRSATRCTARASGRSCPSASSRTRWWAGVAAHVARRHEPGAAAPALPVRGQLAAPPRPAVARRPTGRSSTWTA